MCATTGYGRATTGEFFCYNHVWISYDLGRELQQLMFLLLPASVVCYMLHDLAVMFDDGGDVFTTTAAGFFFIRSWISCNPRRPRRRFAATVLRFCYHRRRFLLHPCICYDGASNTVMSSARCWWGL